MLASGARLHVDRHEANGANVRLYQDGGFVEMAGALVMAFEEDEVTASTTTSPATLPPANPPAATQTNNPVQLANAAADKYGLPRSLVRSVMSTESAGQTGAVSNKGAIGLMQLTPQTAQELGANPYDPVQNVDAGARYLRDLLYRYNGGLWHALAAYNAGPGAVDKYHGVPPFRETINYVAKITRLMNSDTNH